MEMPKVCLGCFSQWDEEAPACPHCGWEPGGEYEEVLGWRSGIVLEKRYLLGKLFCQEQDTAGWRAYDNLLKLPCFLLRRREDTEENLFILAQRLGAVSESRGGFLEVLSVKPLGHKNVLIFSMKDRYMPVSVFRLYLLLALGDRTVRCEGRESYTENPGKKGQALPVGTCLDKRYRVMDCIGAGGFGIIYLCEDEILHRSVAVKEYFPSEWAKRDGEYVAVKTSAMVEAYRYGMRSFLKEAVITAGFIHSPGIVTIYDVIEENDTVYLLTEYIPGSSIGRELRGRGYKPYTTTGMAKIMLPVLDALEEIHDKGIVHSDISPGNIMRSREGEIRLIDLGASKYFLESQPPLSAAFLKPDYAAPEQYRTAREGSPRDEGPWTDIYGAGAAMYYLLTGHKPTDVLTRLSGKNPDLVPPRKYKVKLSKHWMSLIHRAMALKKEERISSAAELGREIRKLL